MDILVKVKSKRKCAGSIDARGDNWILSFGDLDKPETDVEVDCTTEQLLEIRQAIDTVILAKMKPRPVAPSPALSHMGSC